jgi:arylsulfatase A-like enzyme
MMVLGPKVRQGTFIDRPVESLDLVPTLGALRGFATPLAQGRPLAEAL